MRFAHFQIERDGRPGNFHLWGPAGKRNRHEIISYDTCDAGESAAKALDWAGACDRPYEITGSKQVLDHIPESLRAGVPAWVKHSNPWAREKRSIKVFAIFRNAAMPGLFHITGPAGRYGRDVGRSVRDAGDAVAVALDWALYDGSHYAIIGPQCALQYLPDEVSRPVSASAPKMRIYTIKTDRVDPHSDKMRIVGPKGGQDVVGEAQAAQTALDLARKESSPYIIVGTERAIHHIPEGLRHG